MGDSVYATSGKLEKQISEISKTMERDLLSIDKIEVFAKSQVYMSMVKSTYPPLYLVYTERQTTPTINVFLKEGGQLRAIAPRKIDETAICSVSSEMKELARVFIGEDGALETLCMLASEGPQSFQIVTEEIMPKDGMLRVVSELSRCGLVEVVDDKITLTSRGESLMLNIQAHLEE